jgi:hypothetical protein
LFQRVNLRAGILLCLRERILYLTATTLLVRKFFQQPPFAVWHGQEIHYGRKFLFRNNNFRATFRGIISIAGARIARPYSP